MHRILCVPCDNRPFSNKEALQQHLKTSSAWHPVCMVCDKRFSSESGYDAHMAAKHPPTYDCQLCDRTYRAPFALEDHYRGSPAHPNCARCGKGFKDADACDEHLRAAHPKVACVPCGGEVVYEDLDALERHYAASDKHPSCPHCRRGLKDEGAVTEHLNVMHSDLTCESCDQRFSSPKEVKEHYLASSAHPKCQICNTGLKNEDERESHMEAHRDTEQKEESTASGSSPSYIWAHSKFPVMEASSPINNLQPTHHAAKETSIEFPSRPSPSSVFAPVSPPTSVLVKSSPLMTAPVSTFSPILSYRAAISPFLPATALLPATSTPLSRPASLQASSSPSPPKQPNLQQIVTTRQVVGERSETPLYSTGFTPLSPRKNVFRDLSTLGARRIDSPDLRLSTNFASPIKEVQAPVFSPAGLLPPGRVADELWSSRENVQVPTGAPRPSVHSPERPVVTANRPSAWSHSPPQSTSYSQSPNPRQASLRERYHPSSTARPTQLATYTQTFISEPFSPASGSTSSYTSSYASHSSQFSPPKGRASTLDAFSRSSRNSPPRENRFAYSRNAFNTSTTSLIEGPVQKSVSPTRSVASTVIPRSSRGNVRSLGRAPSTETSVGHAQALLPRKLSPPFDFSSRLYPGSARQALRAGNPNQRASATGTHPPVVATANWRTRQALSESMDWRDLMGEDDEFDVRLEAQPIISQEVETPKAESPKSEKNSFAISTGGNEFLSSPSAFSTLSSVMSSELENLAPPTSQQTDIYEETVTASQFKAPEISFTTSTDSSSLRSPDVYSPIGLEALPAISPLPDTPIDISPFDIPEAQKPLPESTLASPVTVIMEVVEDTQPMAASRSTVQSLHSTPSSPRTGSYVTSPQEPDQLSSFGAMPSPSYDIHIPLSSRAQSPVTSWNQFTSSGDELEDNASNTNIENTTFIVRSPSPAGGAFGSLTHVRDPSGSSRDAESTSEVPQTVASSVTSLPPATSLLHCRACKTDPCRDITATLCGHIFCNSCITDAVIKTSRCPVCMTPTLLYCLFRLDLAA